MAKMKKNWLFRALSCALAVTLVSGTAVMTPVAGIVGIGITASAKDVTGSVILNSYDNNIEVGDIIIKGTVVCTEENEAKIIIGSETKELDSFSQWTADKHYSVTNVNKDYDISSDYTTEILTLTMSETTLTGTRKVTFLDSDGTTILKQSDVTVETSPAYTGSIPLSQTEGYVFTGWKSQQSEWKTAYYGKDEPLPVIYADTTYTAVYGRVINSATSTSDVQIGDVLIEGASCSGQT